MGRRTKPGLNLETDLAEGYAALGFADTMTKQIDTNWYMSDVIDLAYAVIDREFDSVMTTLALANPDRYQHVYEPGYVGAPQFKLWENKLYGRGAKKEASFEWRPSVQPILTPKERATDPADPMSKVPAEIIAKLSDRQYVFRMRAPIMEYRMKVTIQPVNTDYLFIPTFKRNWHRRKSGQGYEGRNYRFEKFNMPDWDYRNPQEPSGAENTVGQFTSAWVGFWQGGGAEQVWDTQVAPRISKSFNDTDNEIAKAAKMKRSRKATISIASFNSNEAAWAAGANLARAFIRGKARSYKQASKYIEQRGLNGGEREY